MNAAVAYQFAIEKPVWPRIILFCVFVALVLFVVVTAKNKK